MSYWFTPAPPHTFLHGSRCFFIAERFTTLDAIQFLYLFAMGFERRVSRAAASLDYHPQGIRQPEHEQRAYGMAKWSVHQFVESFVCHVPVPHSIFILGLTSPILPPRLSNVSGQDVIPKFLREDGSEFESHHFLHNLAQFHARSQWRTWPEEINQHNRIIVPAGL